MRQRISMHLSLPETPQAMDQTKAIWIKDPLAILADGAERGIVVRNGKIVELVPRGGQPTTSAASFAADNHVVLPGLINTHHHFYQTLTRALPAALDRELFPWLQALYPVWARLTPQALDLGVTVAMSELLLSGCTTTTDHHYVFPAGLEDAVDIEVAVARRLGVRVLLTRGSMSRSQRDGGLPPDSVVQDEDTILADSERVVGKYHQRGEDAMVQIALAPCSPFTVTTSLMTATAALADRLDVRLHTHLAEVEDENKFCEQMYGCRPLDYLDQCGWLNARTWLGHGVSFHTGGGERVGEGGAGETRNHNPPWRLQQPTAGVRLLPGLRHGRGGSRDWLGRRWLGLQRRIQFDAGSPRGIPVAACALRRRPRQPQGRSSLGDQGIGSLRRPPRTWRDRGREGRRFGVVQARRIAFLRPWRSTGGAGSVRCASRRPGHGRRQLGGDRWRDPRARPTRSDRAPQRGRARDAGGIILFRLARLPPRFALPPCGGELERGEHELRRLRLTPLPNAPPQGGREHISA